MLYTYYQNKWHSNNDLAHKVIKNFLVEFIFEIIEIENKKLKTKNGRWDWKKHGKIKDAKDSIEKNKVRKNIEKYCGLVKNQSC